MPVWYSGFSTIRLLRGIEGGVTPSLRKLDVCASYLEDSQDMHIESEPTESRIQDDNRRVPIPGALLLDIDRDFAPNENNSEIAKLSEQEGPDALDGHKQPNK